MGVIHNIVQDFKIIPDDVPRIQDALFFDGPDQRRNLERFGTLMFFATAIASYGVIGDSTATVIGAMLIAPLMTPILATAAAVVTGQMHRAGRALLTTFGGVLLAISLSWLIGMLYHSGIIDPSTNSQIVSRTSPNLVDLYGAIFSGAVGAFAVSRKDVANTLPGAAIAIALVPPLAVVGLTLSQGDWSDAGGAFLLFLTNFFAILLAGGAMLALLGASAAATSDLHGHARTRAFAVIIAGTLLVAVPLAATSASALNSSLAQSATRNVTEEWLEGTSYELSSVDSTSDGMLIRVFGEGDLPSTDDLIAAIEEKSKKDATVRLEVIPEHIEEFSVSPTGG
jgi:uncharacterized hydrophobic protein (TIGR00271 family)